MDGDCREEDCLIHDRFGHSYRLHMSPFASMWRITAFDGAVCAAYANCNIQPPTLTLSDLKVSDAAWKPEGRFSAFKRRVFNRERKPITYRTRGLGTALLQFIVATAKTRGFVEILGSISPRDLAANPSLPDWYRRRGFTVEPGGMYGACKLRVGFNEDGPG